MKWIVLAILLFIGVSTFISLRYRKPGKPHEPYREAKERSTQKKLEQAGYQRIEAVLSIPADPGRSAASLGKPLAPNQTQSGGLPDELATLLVGKQILPDSIASVTAPSSVSGLMPYAFQFSCTLPDKKYSLGETFVYVKGDDIAIVPGVEKIGGELLARSRDNPVLVTIPGGTLKPGEYHLRLVGRESSRQWTVQVH